jgi:hypothetical protein
VRIADVYLNKSTAEEGVYQLSLVNTSSGSQRPLRDLVPVSGITIQLPFAVKSFTPLLADSEAEVSVAGKTIRIDKLNEFYAIELRQ